MAMFRHVIAPFEGHISGGVFLISLARHREALHEGYAQGNIPRAVSVVASTQRREPGFPELSG